MSRAAKAFDAAKGSAKSLDFSDLCALVEAAGFELKRTSGSHHVYVRPGTVEIINLQPSGKAAKVYQVRQVLALIEKYNIAIR